MHDGKIGIVSLLIIIACFLVFGIVTTHDHSVKAEIIRLQGEVLRSSHYNAYDVLVESVDPALASETQAQIEARSDSLNALIEELTTNRLWMIKLSFIPEKKSLLAFLFSMFIHGGWEHLIGNLLFFYVCGVVMEKYWGHFRFFFVYLASGVAATLAYLLQGTLFAGPEWSSIPLLGASGAIAGTMGAMLAVYPKCKVRIFYWIFRYSNTFEVKALYYMGFWIITQIIYVLLDPKMNMGVAFSAHVGGFAAGMLFGFLLKGDEMVLETSNRSGKRVRANRPPSFVMLTSDNQPVKNVLEPVELKLPEAVEGWQLFEEGKVADASLKISRGIDNLFHQGESNRLDIADNIRKLGKSWQQLTISGTQIYQWGQKLQQMNMTDSALICFDIAKKANAPGHVQVNSRYAASALRIRLHFEVKQAAGDLLWIIKKMPGSIPARHSQELLNSLLSQYGDLNRIS